MQTTQSLRNRLGAASLIVGIVVFGTGLTHPDADAAVAAQIVASSGWLLGHLGLIVGHILVTFGLLSIYSALATSRVERMALVALVLSLIGIGLQLPGFGMLAIALPVLGQQGATNAVAALLNSPFLAIFLGIGSLVLAIGAVLFAFAVGRSGRLSLPAAIIYAVGSVALIPEPVLGQTGRGAVGLLLVIGGVWLGVAVWQNASGPEDRAQSGFARSEPDAGPMTAR